MHIVGPETGLSQPGMVLCAGDSHTCFRIVDIQPGSIRGGFS